MLCQVGQRIEVLPGDAFHGGNRVGADTLVGLRVHVPEGQVAIIQEGAHRGAFLAEGGHHFGATADDQVLGPGHDVHSCQVNGGDA